MMVLQNIVWDEIEEGTRELYSRGNNIEYLKDKILIPSKGNLVTDTYMNVFDVDTWKKYALMQNLELKIELCGKGKLNIYTLEKNTAEMEIPFWCLRRDEISIPIPDEYIGKIYFEIEADSKIDFYKACYQTADKVLQKVKIAVVICTYQRDELLKQLLHKLKEVKKSLKESMEVFVVDNASELKLEEASMVHLFHNPNTGGSGGFSRGMDEVVNYYSEFQATHVLLMDDDVVLQQESILRLYSLLSYLRSEYQQEVVAGRMFRMDKPWIQYTAAEIWNGGDIKHIGFELDMRNQENFLSINDNSGAEYSGWWFCCIPYEFVKNNRPLPFFLHCDDVEYGLRHGGTPIILNGIQVWHETYEYRQSLVITYYDMRNSLFVNEILALKQGKNIKEINSFYEEVLRKWKKVILKYHLEEDWTRKYCVTLAVYDWLRGQERLRKINCERLHFRLKKIKASKIKNALAWRYVEYIFKKKFKEIRNV